MLKLDCMIKEAKWTMADASLVSPIISRRFTARNVRECKIAISSFGFFTLYVNGRRIGEDYYTPLHSIYHRLDFEKMLYPISDEFTYRAYYLSYDIFEHIIEGENTIEIHLGNGFYRQSERFCEGDWRFGASLGAIYAIGISDNDGERYVLSDASEVARDSATRYSELFIGEVYDCRLDGQGVFPDTPTYEGSFPDTVLTPAHNALDRVADKVEAKLISNINGRRIYDVGINITGFATVRTSCAYGEEVVLRFSENIKGDELDFTSTGSLYVCRSGRAQIMEDRFIGDGREHIWHPSFVWHAFRYIELVGDAELDSVSVIHSDVGVTSDFTSSSPELNWLYDAFIRTQLNNMHCGFPSDCPHRERLGYTGDGQICSFAAMNLLDSREFYRKWIRDIFDSQDKIGGHVTHTAPFAGGGGGPGGWGSAAVIVPYNYYKSYGDKYPLYENYDGMKRWIDYLIRHSDNGLVTSEEDGGWVLGDWATPEECRIPEPLVNTAYLIKDLEYMIEIAAAIGKDEDITFYKKELEKSRQALRCAYFDEAEGSFADGIQGADAYGIFCGASDGRAIDHLYAKYSLLGRFDTGFLATYILVGILFDEGLSDLAYSLLTSHKLGSYGYMMDRGATTVWESWSGDSSHDHPMFGASAEYLFTKLLGITQESSSAGYSELLISPKIPRRLGNASGSLRTARGTVSLSFTKDEGKVIFHIGLPEGITARFVYCGISCTLTNIDNKLVYDGKSLYKEN
ncbi:MAG: family 78 glycoside hydrolase catalytic domain [Clostridia bacterium]|nr:family 78 glycoside hydrolase catalytic domain [Clostridia bacterium]